MSQTASQQGNLIGATLAGKYTLTGQLGEGAMGVVYEAVTPEGRLVAVKTLLAAARQQLGSEALSRFVREAQVSSAVKNPHVVDVLDAGHDEASDVAFMVMEVLRGEDLEQLLSRTGALRPEVAVRVALQAARGLAAAHAQGTVHRDVKPSNIFLHQGDGGEIVVKVCDFGIAKEATQADQGLTQTGSVLGSPLYMAPEQLLNAKKTDHRADIWGLAMSVFDALAGEPALQDVSNLPALVMALARQDVRTLSEAAPWCDPGLSAALEGALQRDPTKRYETMDAFIEALVPFRGGDDETLRGDQLVGLDAAEKERATRAAGPRVARTATPAALSAAGPQPERYVGQTLVKRYHLQRLVRQGADGWIYEARTVNNSRPCHIRLVPRSLVGSSREAEALVERARPARELRHPNLVRVLDAGIDPITTMPFVVFEPCEGKSLSEFLSERGKLPTATAAGIALHLARALVVVHRAGSQHGAVRPGAVHLVERPGPGGTPALVAQLAGWGEAKLSFEPVPPEGPDQVTALTRSMAPEQARESNKELSARTDIWGLSMVLYEMLAGRHPLAAYRAMGDLILGICVHEVPRLSVLEPDASPKLVELLARGLQRNPDKRPASIDDMARALTPLAGPMASFPPDQVEEFGVMPEATRAPVPEEAPPSTVRRSSSAGGRVIAAVVVGVAVVAAVAALAMR